MDKLQLDESLAIKYDEELVFGSNQDDFNDGKIGIFRPLTMMYLVYKEPDTKLFYICALNYKTGELLLTTTRNGNIQSQLRNPMLRRPINVIHAYKKFNIMYNLIARIIKKFYMRIPRVMFIANNVTIMKMIERNFRNGTFRMLFQRYQYTVTDFAEKGDDYVYYLLQKKKS